MQPSARQISTCPTCGGVLEKTPGGGLGCMSCLLRAGIGSEEETVQDSTTDAPEGGMRFGVYEIDCREDGRLYELGRGAMGVTYRATDTSLQRKVALKIIKIDIAERSADARERFMREARAAAALRHENIATIHQFGMRLETGQYFYAMELIEGETLEERVRRAGPLDARTTIKIAQQVTSALAAAEKHGLVHRDLKPANLMLVSLDVGAADVSSNNNLRVKIIDFGLAKAIHTQTDPKSLTHDRFVGTPAFASPEQFQHAALDVRSDIYSLGETLWFALTGKTPFAGRSMEEIHRAQQSNMLPLEQLKAAHVPSRLRSLLESMLALEPASRPGTHDLAERLRRCSAEARGARRTRVVLAVSLIALTAAVGWIIWKSEFIRHPVTNGVAVLPFENLSSDPDNAYFALGIQDEILTRLVSIAGLKVISRTSTQGYQSKPRNLREIAKQLGVANIVEGSVQKAADQVRVNVQLVNAQTDSHLWADTYDRKLTDIFGVESEIAKGIAAALQAKLTGREEQALTIKPTNNPEAYDAYLRGLAFEARFFSSFGSRDLGKKAVSFFERAVQLDPNFALAWARLSRTDSMLYFARSDTAEAAEAARSDAAKRALENAQKLAPNSPETLLASGYYQLWVLQDYGLAKTTFSRVSKLLPGSSEVPYALARVTLYEGQLDQSVAYFEQAIALDPRNVEVLNDTAWTYATLRQLPAALKLYDRVLDITPNDPNMMAAKAGIYQAEGNLQEAARSLPKIDWPFFPWHTFVVKMTQLRLERNYGELIRLLQTRVAQFHFDLETDRATDQVWLALTQRLAGDTASANVSAEQARNTFEEAFRDRPDHLLRLEGLSKAHALTGKKELAIKEAERAVMLVPRSKDPQGVPSFDENLALVQTILGEDSRAISILTRLLQTPYDSPMYPFVLTPALLRLDPIWDPLRADPAFQKLCEEKQP
jgi:serine/threonine protein kinase